MSKIDIPANLSKKINGINKTGKIKLRIRITKTNIGSLYLDYWNKYIGKREYMYLDLFLDLTRSSKNSDLTKLEMAIAMRNQKENILAKEKNQFLLNYSAEVDQKEDIYLISYINELINRKSKQRATWNVTVFHLKNFLREGDILLIKVDRKFCLKFKEYLLTKVSAHSAKTYFGKLKATLNIAIEEEIIEKNAASKILIRFPEPQKEYLTDEEIKKLIKTSCNNINIRNAFLFSCFTGLRVSDIIRLKQENIKEGYLHFRQKKTKDLVTLKLSISALKILKQATIQAGEYIFELPTTGYINHILKEWMKKAGINKHITFHCGRHTFATMCLTHDVDIYTVSKLLGHTDLASTEVYAKIIDKKKDSAVDKLPSF